MPLSWIIFLYDFTLEDFQILGNSSTGKARLSKVVRKRVEDKESSSWLEYMQCYDVTDVILNVSLSQR